MIKYCLLSSVFLVASGCAGTSGPIKGEKPIEEPDTPTTEAACEATNPKDVHMWLNRMPGSDINKRASLFTTFTATTGTPGYKFDLRVNRTMESAPEKVVMDLMVVRAVGVAFPQVLTEHKVRIKVDGFPGPEGSSVQVNCMGKPFFKVDKVMAVH